MEETHYTANNEINEATPKYHCEGVASSAAEDGWLTFASPIVF